ncbi:MAG: sauU 5 [Planctomycetota bacterium]|nr:sauU 5 [Planctomycetota bacterium]
MSQAPVQSVSPAGLMDVTPPKDSPTRIRFLVLGGACLLAIITYLHRVGFSAIATELRDQLHLGDRAIGYFTAAFMIAYGIFEVPWGLLADARGGRSALTAVVIGGSLMTAAVAAVVWLPDPAGMGLIALILARFAFGAFQAGTFPVLARIMADWMPVSERGGAQGALWMSTRLGGALAPIVLIPLFHRFGNWRMPLVIGAGLGLIWCVGFWSIFRNTPQEIGSVNAAERELIAHGRKKRQSSSHRTPWGQIFGRTNPLALCVMYGSIGYSGNFFLFMLNDYLRTQRHLGKNTAMWLTSLPFFAGVFACVMGGVLSDLLSRQMGSRRWGRRVVGCAGLSLAAVGIISTLAVTNVFALGVLLCLTFIGNDLAMGPSWAAATEIGERSAGTLGGTMNMVGSFTAAIAAILTAERFARLDGTTPFLLFGLSYLIGALCWLRIDVTEPLVATTGDLEA